MSWFEQGSVVKVYKEDSFALNEFPRMEDCLAEVYLAFMLAQGVVDVCLV